MPTSFRVGLQRDVDFIVIVPTESHVALMVASPKLLPVSLWHCFAGANSRCYTSSIFWERFQGCGKSRHAVANSAQIIWRASTFKGWRPNCAAAANMGHGYKHREVKKELVDWLWSYDDEAFWKRLASYAGKDWPAFAKCVKGAWRDAGGNPGDLCFLDNKQHSVNVWQLVNRASKLGPSKKERHLQTKAELVDWLWYYENAQFWEELEKCRHNKGWRAFGATVRREWQNNGGNVQAISFLDNSQHVMDLQSVMFKGAQPQLPRQPRFVPR